MHNSLKRTIGAFVMDRAHVTCVPEYKTAIDKAKSEYIERLRSFSQIIETSGISDFGESAFKVESNFDDIIINMCRLYSEDGYIKGFADAMSLTQAIK